MTRKLIGLAPTLCLGAALATVPAEANVEGGRQVTADTVDGYSTDVYTPWFHVGWARVDFSGDGDTDVDCYVDNIVFNVIIASDERPTDDCVMSWYVTSPGRFRIRIKNLGAVYNNYQMLIR